MFSRLWEGLCLKRPSLRNPESQVTITSENLRRMCEQFYDHGVKDERKGSGSPFGDMFDNIFKGMKR